MLEQLSARPLATVSGAWTEILFRDESSECTVLVLGEVADQATPVLCRIHSDCLSAHLLLSIECDCREQMIIAQQKIVKARKGVVITLPQDGRGYGHEILMRAISFARERNITQSAAYREVAGGEDGRSYSMAAAVLSHLKVKRVNLLTNNPLKRQALEDCGIRVARLTPVIVPDMTTSPRLRETYQDKLLQGHLLGG